MSGQFDKRASYRNGSREGLLPPGAPVAELHTIHLGRLQEGSVEESSKLFHACKNNGFFYLDLRHANNNNPLRCIDEIYDLSEELFGLDIEEKLAYDVDKISDMKVNGYKPLGRNLGGLAGKSDGFETYSIPKDGIMGLNATPFPHPPILDRYAQPLKDFTAFVQHAGRAIFSSLSSSLGLPEGQGFERHHRPNASSPDMIRLLKYHAQPATERGGVPQIAHTDLGSLTFLFSRQPGLQLRAPGTTEWRYVVPRPGHAIINLGDGMSLLTNKFFHSCLHRVAPLPGRAMDTRYSFAYMMRAENDTPLTGLESDLIPRLQRAEPVLTNGEWLRIKFGMLRLKTHDQKGRWILTGTENNLEECAANLT